MKTHFAVTKNWTLASDKDLRTGDTIPICGAKLRVHQDQTNRPDEVDCLACQKKLAKATIHLITPPE